MCQDRVLEQLNNPPGSIYIRPGILFVRVHMLVRTIRNEYAFAGVLIDDRLGKFSGVFRRSTYKLTLLFI